MSRKVYLVTSGDYDFCNHHAAFTERTDAERYAGALDGDTDIVEIELDPKPPKDVRYYYAATVDHEGHITQRREFWAHANSALVKPKVETVWEEVSSEQRGGVTITRRREVPLACAPSDVSMEESERRGRSMIAEWFAKREGAR